VSFRIAGGLAFAGVLGVVAPAAAQVGGWVSANATRAQPATNSDTQMSAFPFRGEEFQATHIYTRNPKTSLDGSLGVRVGKFGAGLAISRYVDPEPALAYIRVPNPVLLNTVASAAATPQTPLSHQETALHGEVRYVASVSRLDVAIFAGPSYFIAVQSLVTSDTYQEVFDPVTFAATVSITGYGSRHSEVLRAWGFNVGADVAYYFSSRIGVGSLVRFSRARVNLPNDLQAAQTGSVTTQSATIGGFSIGGGLRFRW
jgi:hypothetical protein